MKILLAFYPNLCYLIKGACLTGTTIRRIDRVAKELDWKSSKV